MAWSSLSPEQKAQVATDLADQVMAGEGLPHEPHKATVTTPEGFSVIYENSQARTTLRVADECAQDFAAMDGDYSKFTGMEFCRRHVRAIRLSLRRSPV